jgi:hypothetical protein
LVKVRCRAEFIDKENAVRFVDAFVEQMEDLKNKAVLTGVL